jgi:hypothetical protein
VGRDALARDGDDLGVPDVVALPVDHENVLADGERVAAEPPERGRVGPGGRAARERSPDIEAVNGS